MNMRRYKKYSAKKVNTNLTRYDVERFHELKAKANIDEWIPDLDDIAQAGYCGWRRVLRSAAAKVVQSLLKKLLKDNDEKCG